MAQHDVFPAFVLIAQKDDETPLHELSTFSTRGDQYRFINTARVVVHGTRMLIATDSNSGPLVVFNEEIDPNTLTKSREGDSSVLTSKGVKVVYRKDSNCGCGSRLKSWSPFRTMNSVKDPS